MVKPGPPNTALQTDERRTSVVTYCEMTLAPLAAGRQSYADARSEAVKNPRGPTWLSDGHRYYSQIGPESTDPVRVFSAGDEEVSNEKPGTLCVHLEPASRFVRVFDADRQDRGIIRSEGLRPLGRYVMRLNTEVVWVLSVSSIVRKRHTLWAAVGDRWTFDTPFFWWQQLAGSVAGTPRLLGEVGPTKRLWFMIIEAGRDTPDVLAAVAFMHRKWWRW